MHEVHLVREIVEKVEQEAAATGAKHVKRVRIRFNRLTSHSGDHVRFSFDIMKKESAMTKDAVLELTEVVPLVCCRRCGHKFEGNQLPDICPVCYAVDVEPVNPTDMVLEGFET